MIQLITIGVLWILLMALITKYGNILIPLFIADVSKKNLVLKATKDGRFKPILVTYEKGIVKSKKGYQWKVGVNAFNRLCGIRTAIVYEDSSLLADPSIAKIFDKLNRIGLKRQDIEDGKEVKIEVEENENHMTHETIDFSAVMKYLREATNPSVDHALREQEKARTYMLATTEKLQQILPWAMGAVLILVGGAIAYHIVSTTPVAQQAANAVIGGGGTLIS